MLYLFLAVITSVIVATVIKSFEKYNISNFQAIGINYIVCIISGVLSVSGFKFQVYSQYKINFKGAHEFATLSSSFSIIHEPWFLSAILLGLGFVTMFNVFALATRKIGIALSTVSSKMSVIIPVYFGILLYGDNFNVYKIIGLIFTLFAFYFIFKKEKDIPFRKLYFFLSLLLFTGNGFNDSLQTYTQRSFKMGTDMILIFMIIVYTTALFSSIMIFIYRRIAYKEKVYKRNIIGGLILGIFNFATTFYFLKCIGHYSSTFIFPIFNVCIVSLTTLVGILFFKEKLRPLNWIGFILAILAIIIIAIG